MLDFTLSPALLGNTRFTFSPLVELGSSLRLLGMPRTGHPHQRWIQAVRSQLPGAVDMELLGAVCPPTRWPPDFLFASTDTDTAAIGDQLERLRRYPPGRFVEDLDLSWSGRPRPRIVHALVSDPGAALDRLVDQLEAYWSLALFPHWSRICAVLEDDVAYRASRAVNGGLYDLLRDLHPQISIDGLHLRIDKPAHCDERHHGDTLILTPSVFLYPSLVVSHDALGLFSVAYTARGVGRLWENSPDTSPRDADPLASLLGPTRARILRRLDVPKSTTQTAREMRLTTSNVSQHLSVLRANGLLYSWRTGRDVLYRQTDLASSLVATSARADGAGIA